MWPTSAREASSYKRQAGLQGSRAIRRELAFDTSLEQLLQSFRKIKYPSLSAAPFHNPENDVESFINHRHATSCVCRSILMLEKGDMR